LETRERGRNISERQMKRSYKEGEREVYWKKRRGHETE
jgi:hypothetical protein